jgi:hypothetical protein
MFAEKFLPLISRFPQDAQALQRIADYFEGIEKRNGSRVYQVRLDSRMLFDICQAGSTYRVAHVTSLLISEGILERRVVVRTPQGQGIEFLSYDDLPDVVRDPVRDVDMIVTDENVEASYVVVPDGRH